MTAVLSDPVPFDQALAFARDRVSLPTTLGHGALATLRRELGARALILARVSDARILSAVHRRVNELARGIQERPGDYMDPATFRVEMQQILNLTGYQAEAGREGTISDLRSTARLNLIVDTETELAAGRAQQAADLDPDISDAFPAWELYRATKPNGIERDWEERWRIAADQSGDTTAMAAFEATGRMMARKDSAIWTELGSTDNFDDALDTDHPPFAFNSGMAVKNVNRRTAMDAGLIERGQRIAAQQRPQSPMRVNVSDISPQIRDALLRATPGASLSTDGDMVDEGGAA